jgi:ribosomal protein L37AE/L43A
MKRMKKETIEIIERRPHGCDGCRKDVPTERFNGYRGNHIWLCSKCFLRITGIKGNG